MLIRHDTGEILHLDHIRRSIEREIDAWRRRCEDDGLTLDQRRDALLQRRLWTRLRSAITPLRQLDIDGLSTATDRPGDRPPCGACSRPIRARPRTREGVTDPVQQSVSGTAVHTSQHALFAPATHEERTK